MRRMKTADNLLSSRIPDVACGEICKCNSDVSFVAVVETYLHSFEQLRCSRQTRATKYWTLILAAAEKSKKMRAR
jgi:hypothetical protein